MRRCRGRQHSKKNNDAVIARRGIIIVEGGKVGTAHWRLRSYYENCLRRTGSMAVRSLRDPYCWSLRPWCFSQCLTRRIVPNEVVITYRTLSCALKIFKVRLRVLATLNILKTHTADITRVASLMAVIQSELFGYWRLWESYTANGETALYWRSHSYILSMNVWNCIEFQSHEKRCKFVHKS